MQGQRSTEMTYNLRSSSSRTAMSLAGGGSSSASSEHFTPPQENRRKRKNTSPPASSSSNNSIITDDVPLNSSQAPMDNPDTSETENFVRSTRSRTNYFVIELEDDGSDSDQPSPDPPILTRLPSPSQVELTGDAEPSENINERTVRQTIGLESRRERDRDRWSRSDVDYSSLMRALVAVRERSEERGRVLSELRNVLDILRNSENVGNEDLLFVHRVMSMARGTLFDRHRDMRLDVDNMSYEELLALEERIGNVNTGLSEEKAITCLKQSIFAPPHSSDSVIEPCCICQEEYEEGSEVGRLSCGHDFHMTCIKQWLSHKNMCPICKAAALDN